MDDFESGGAAFVALMILIGGPFFVLVPLIRELQWLSVAGAVLLGCSCIAAFVRDIRRKRAGWISVLLLLGWMLLKLPVGFVPGTDED